MSATSSSAVPSAHPGNAMERLLAESEARMHTMEARSVAMSTWTVASDRMTLEIRGVRDDARELATSLSLALVANACGGPRWLWGAFVAVSVFMFVMIARGAVRCWRAFDAERQAWLAYESVKAGTS